MNMIRSDTYRIFKSLGFKMYLLCLLINYGITLYYQESGGINMTNSSMAAQTLLDSYKLDIQMVGHNGSFYYFFIIPIFVIILADFSTGAVKNSIASVFSRARYFVLKFLYSLSFVLISFIAVNMLFYAVNNALNGSKYSSGFGDFAKAVCSQLPLCAAISSLFILLAFLIRKAAFFNTVTIILPYVYVVVDVFFAFALKLPKVVEFMNEAYYDTIFYKLAANPSGEYLAKIYAGCAAMVIVCFIAGLQVFRKSEL